MKRNVFLSITAIMAIVATFVLHAHRNINAIMAWGPSSQPLS